MFVASAMSAASFGAPASIQRRSVWLFSLSFVKSLPPVCGASPLHFVTSIEASGVARLMRRPIISRVRRKWSPAGS